jgi:hypothetical protein
MAGGFSCFDVWTGMTWSMDQLATRHQAADQEGCLLRTRGIPMWRIVTTALLAGALAIAVSQGHVGDAIIVGVMLLLNVALNVVLVVLTATGKRGNKKT